MFITLTIDTKIKNKSRVTINKSKINPSNGWRMAIHPKKRNLLQKVKSRINEWKRSLKNRNIKMAHASLPLKY